MDSQPDMEPRSRGQPLDDSLLDMAQFGQLRDALARYSGVFIDEGRQRLLSHAVAERLAATGWALDRYLRQCALLDDQRELHLLTELILNHETLFFRNMPHMRALSEEVLPQLHQRKPPGKPLRLWSAGCATGEEAYSLAITVLQTFGSSFARPVEIIGTDLSEGALEKARAGIYRGRTLTNVASDLRERYFIQQGDDWAVGDEVRALVRFQQLNLLEPFPAWTQDIDLIFCQNVTIYFQLHTCRALMERFYATLPEGGMLFLGFSETIWHIFNRFLTREVAGSFVYYKESSVINDNRSAANNAQRRSARLGPLTPGTPGSDEQVRRGVERPNMRVVPEQHAKDDGGRLLRRSRALLAEGHAEQALETLRHLPPTSDQTPAALVLVARAHADRNDLDLALAEALRARDLDPLNTDAYMLLGLIYGRKGQEQAAIEQFERARYLDAAAPLPSFYLAEAYRQQGREEAAIREYRNTLQKLAPHPPGTLLDGVAVGWIREICQRYVQPMATRRRGV